MATVTRFEDLNVWKLARALATKIFELYKASEVFYKDYKLREQINASSGSVMDNIAEGFNRGSTNEFINFLSYAKGSVGEVKSQLYRVLDRKYLNEKGFQEMYALADLVGAKIATLTKYLNGCGYKGSKFKDRQKHENECPIIPLSDIDFPDQIEKDNEAQANQSATDKENPKQP